MGMTLLAGGVLLGVLIFVHELGHFLVAKATGVRVLTFSLGFGPRLFGFKRGDTDYRISALPLGGYVRMYGDEPNEEIPDDQKHRAFLHKPFLQKSAIAVAGPVANFLLPIALFAAVFAGTERVNDTVVGTVFADEPAALAGLAAGDRIVEVDGAPVTTFGDVQKRVEAKPGVRVKLTVERGGARQDLVVTTRAAPNPSPLDDAKVGRIGITPLVELPVVAVLPNSVAAQAGLKNLDRVTAIDGAPIATRGELLARLDADPRASLRLTVVAQAAPGKGGDAPAAEAPPHEIMLPGAAETPPPAANEDQRVAVTVDELPALRRALDDNRAATERAVGDAWRRRGVMPVDGLVLDVEAETAAARGLAVHDHIVAIDGRPLTYSAQLDAALNGDKDGVHVAGVVGPAGHHQLAFRLMESQEPELAGMKVFGAATANAYGPGSEFDRHVGLGEAIGRGVDVTWKLAKDTVKGFGMLFTGRVGLSNLGGPITIFNLAGKAAENGLYTFIHMMALISVNLGILNLLPVPVLDGGHLMLFTVEAVRRKKLDLATRERVAKVGLVFVLALMVTAIGNDIMRLF